MAAKKKAANKPTGGRSATQQKGAAVAAELRQNIVFGLDPFELFCAYHLGITPENTYRFQNVHDVARRFGVTPGEVRQALQVYGMDPDAAINSKFNMAVAQVDVQVAPPGVDLLTLAQMHYEEFLGSPRKARKWSRELERDAAENELIFNKRAPPPDEDIEE
ncbi:MAG: hypothetical protein HY904_25485 [Deltaproteobacteria bacterium]|nr:hypothetical protein [Deltaproteobacteria bacterium]